MEERILRVIFSKDGRGATNTKITLPIKWVRTIGASPEDREVTVELDKENNRIIISKK